MTNTTPQSLPSRPSARPPNRLLAVMVPLALAAGACGLFDDDEPPAGGTDGGPSPGEVCTELFETAVAEGACPYPMATVVVSDLEGDTVFWVDDPASATTIGPGGWLFGNVTSADWLGYKLGGDATCDIACVVPQGHPCFQEDNQYCAGGTEETQACLYCGPATASECGDFINTCAGIDDPGSSTSGADTTAGDGQDTTDGSDTTDGPDEASPYVAMFTDHPDVTFGTTQLVLDRLGVSAPPNLVAEDACDAYDPEQAVSEWFGDAIVDRSVFLAIVDRAEVLLGHCDHLQLATNESGIELVRVEPRTLAAELGFQAGDVVLDLNGVPATDPIALMQEVMQISQESTGVATISFSRTGKLENRVVRVQ